MYRVVVPFLDLKTGIRYEVGDAYESTPERIEELSTTANRRGVVLIKAVEEEEKPKTKKKKKKTEK